MLHRPPPTHLRLRSTQLPFQIPLYISLLPQPHKAVSQGELENASEKVRKQGIHFPPQRTSVFVFVFISSPCIDTCSGPQGGAGNCESVEVEVWNDSVSIYFQSGNDGSRKDGGRRIDTYVRDVGMWGWGRRYWCD